MACRVSAVAEVEFPEEVVAEALRRIYEQEVDVRSEVDKGLFAQTWRTFNRATEEGFGERSLGDPDGGFYEQLIRNNAVYSAFRVHRQQNDLAAALRDENGELKPFDRWREDVQPMLRHQVHSWLRTEYNTAVLRAHQAADWQRFERDADLFPCLEWMPSTSAEPDELHKGFWGTILRVNDPFWSANRPGDRWNCKCSLRQTDAPPTALSNSLKGSKADPGLENNPGVDGKLFSDTNPHRRNAYPGAKGAVDRLMKETDGKGFRLCKEWRSGGKLYSHPKVDTSKGDYKDILTIGRQFAEGGEEVKLLPSVHFKSQEYQEIFGSLRGTPYERKCPDLQVGNVFYEYESFVKPWKKRKVSHMIKHGAEQSDHIIINNNKGCTHRYIRRNVIQRLNDKNFKNQINRVCVYEKGKIIEVYKKQ